MERRADNEGRKKDLASEWGSFWEVMGNWVGNYLLGVIGFAADFAVAFALLYSATQRTAPSVLFALAFCAAIQWGFGASVFKVTKGIKRGDFTRDAFRASIVFASFFAVLTLTISLYFSVNTDKLVEVAGKPKMQEELQDVNGVNAYYDEQVLALTQQYNSELASLQKQIKDLRNDKNADGETRWLSLKSATKLEQTELPALKESYRKRIEQRERERVDEIALINADNANVKDAFTVNVLRGGQATKWMNVSINIIRVFLLMAFAVFVQNVSDERSARRKVDPPPHVMAVSNTGPDPQVTSLLRKVANLEQQLSEKPKEVVRYIAPPSPPKQEKKTNNNDAAERLRKLKAKRRVYKSYLKNGQRDPKTVEQNISEIDNEIAEIEKALA